MKRVFCAVLCLCFLVFPIDVGAVSVSAKGAVLINADTGEIIFEHNAETRLSMASTTKIMTALLLCESGDLSREVTVTAEMLRVEGTSMGLLPGDKVTLEGLLYGMMLPSGNDAANATAFILGGTVDGFVKKMNQKAVQLGLKNTHFETPSGLDGEEHYTTAYDLAMITRYALQNPHFKKAVSCKSAVVYYGNPPYRRTLTNHNRLLKMHPDCVGVKTGFTKKSGRCLVSAAERDGKRVIAVTLYDPDDWRDHKAMLDYGLERIVTTEIKPESCEYELPVVNSDNQNVKVTIAPLKVNYLENKGFSCRVNLPEFLYAPIKKDEKIGSVVFLKDGKMITEREIKAGQSVSVAQNKKSVLEEIKENLKYIFKGIWEI